MFETMASFVLSDHLFGRAFEPPLGARDMFAALSRQTALPDKDGFVCVVVYTDEQWRRFLAFIERTRS